MRAINDLFANAAVRSAALDLSGEDLIGVSVSVFGRRSPVPEGRRRGAPASFIYRKVFVLVFRPLQSEERV